MLSDEGVARTCAQCATILIMIQYIETLSRLHWSTKICSLGILDADWINIYWLRCICRMKAPSIKVGQKMHQNAERSRCPPTTLVWILGQLRPNGGKRAVLNLNRQGFATFLPCYATRLVVRNRCVERMKPVFPGYLFIQVDDRRPRWTTIASTSGITRLVTLDGRRPGVVPASVIEALMADCDEAGILRTCSNVAPGDPVVLRSAAFFGRRGIVDALDGNQRVSILLDCMGRTVSLTLPKRDVERADGVL